MLRLILFVVVGVFVAIGVLAAALYHFFAWKGLVVFALLMIGSVWAAKFLVKTLIKKFALGLFGMKARVLRGATMDVHSIKSVREPQEAAEVSEESQDADDGGTTEKNKVAKTGSETPKDYVELDVIIVPKSYAGDSVWEPSELILTSDKIKSLADLEEKEVGTVHSLEIWDGSAFGPDDPGKYPGEQRLKIIFEVQPGANAGWLHYYNEPIGHLKLPVRTIEV